MITRHVIRLLARLTAMRLSGSLGERRYRRLCHAIRSEFLTENTR